MIFFGKFKRLLPPKYNAKVVPRLTINSIYLHWSSVALLESNRLLVDGVDLTSDPRNSSPNRSLILFILTSAILDPFKGFYNLTEKISKSLLRTTRAYIEGIT